MANPRSKIEHGGTAQGVRLTTLLIAEMIEKLLAAPANHEVKYRRKDHLWYYSDLSSARGEHSVLVHVFSNARFLKSSYFHGFVSRVRTRFGETAKTRALFPRRVCCRPAIFWSASLRTARLANSSSANLTQIRCSDSSSQDLCRGSAARAK